MKLLIIGIIIFLVVLYIYTFIKYKKRKNSHVSAVEEFKRKYQHVDDVNAQEDSVIINKTKFNSDLDYIEPGQLIQECQEMKEPKPAKKFGKLQF